MLKAANAAAIAVLAASSNEVQVPLTDAHMPGSMDGMELAEQVHAKWPHVRLLISWGYARPRPDEIPDHGRFVPKPSHAATIVREIHELVHMAKRWRKGR